MVTSCKIRYIFRQKIVEKSVLLTLLLLKAFMFSAL